MTKEQFISGVSFRVKSNTNYSGAPTFKCDGGSTIIKESRHHENEKLMYTQHHLNITKVGRNGFVGYTFILNNKKINIKHKFEDLIEFVAGE
jgi:hypothetical protein